MNRSAWRDGHQGLRSRSRSSWATTIDILGLVIVLSIYALTGCAPKRRLNPDFPDGAADIRGTADQGGAWDQADATDSGPDAGDLAPGQGGAGGGAMANGGGAADSSDGAATDGDAGDDVPGDGPRDTVEEKPPMCGICEGATPICNPDAGMCRSCASNDECQTRSPDARFCSAGGCVGCIASTDCPPARPICGDVTRTCAPCQDNAACVANYPTSRICLGGACVGCATDADCAGPKPICGDGHVCVPCATNGQCANKSSTLPACNAGPCVECNASSDCSTPSKPVCVAHACKACTTDQQCMDKLGLDPGVCMFQADGRCALNNEVLYVAPTSLCDDSTSSPGTAAKPFCTPQRAISAVTAARSVIVLRPGLVTLLNWSAGKIAGVPELTVIGQQGAAIGPGVGVGITITSGNVYIRGLAVTMMLDLGIHVPTGDTMLRMDRCIVTRNKGGLLIDGAGFEINNSVFAGNTNNDVALMSRSFGGVYLGGVATKPMVFRNNTIYQNGGPGLVCGGPYVVRGLLVASNMTSQITGCDFGDQSSSVDAIDPQFDLYKPYHLTAGSRCVDMGSLTDFPPDDLDGNPRPSGARSDCGAVEFQHP